MKDLCKNTVTKNFFRFNARPLNFAVKKAIIYSKRIHCNRQNEIMYHPKINIFKRNFIESSNPFDCILCAPLCNLCHGFKCKLTVTQFAGALFTHIRSDSALCSYENASYQFVRKIVTLSRPKRADLCVKCVKI